jgi:hypothetical protein
VVAPLAPDAARRAARHHALGAQEGRGRAPSSTIAPLLEVVVDAAKAAAPYVHARKRPVAAAEAERKELTHEECVWT